MKLKIKNTPDGLKYASCYIGAELIDDECISCKLTGCLDGDGFYYTALMKGENLDYNIYNIRDEITLDTEADQPCIYACMREGMKVEVTWQKDGLKQILDLSNHLEKINLMFYMSQDEIKSIKVLGDFDGVEVEE